MKAHGKPHNWLATVLQNHSPGSEYYLLYCIAYLFTSGLSLTPGSSDSFSYAFMNSIYSITFSPHIQASCPVTHTKPLIHSHCSLHST